MKPTVSGVLILVCFWRRCFEEDVIKRFQRMSIDTFFNPYGCGDIKARGWI
jgi:hypothetical protein